jgi:hypothetical protein
MRTLVCSSIAALLVGCSSGTATHRSPGPIATPTGAAPSVTLPCSDAIASELQPSADNAVILGVVALPTSQTRPSALQTGLSGAPDPSARLFAKEGLEIRAGAAFELIVPDQVANRFSIGWGSPGRRTRRLIVPGCHGHQPWLAYAGGYWARQVGCLPLLVRAGAQEQRVLIGVGTPCSGQRPPPQPTQA